MSDKQNNLQLVVVIVVVLIIKYEGKPEGVTLSEFLIICSEQCGCEKRRMFENCNPPSDTSVGEPISDTPGGHR